MIDSTIDVREKIALKYFTQVNGAWIPKQLSSDAVDALKKEVVSLTKEISALRKQLAEANEKILSLQGALTLERDKQKPVDGKPLEDRIAMLTNTLKDKEVEISHLKSALASRSNEESGIASELAKAREEAAKNAALIASLSSDLQIARSMPETLRKEVIELNDKLRNSKRVEEAAREEMRHALSDFELSEQTKTELEREVMRLRSADKKAETLERDLAAERERFVNYRAMIAEKWRAEELKILNLVGSSSARQQPAGGIEAARKSCEKMLSDIDSLWARPSVTNNIVTTCNNNSANQSVRSFPTLRALHPLPPPPPRTPPTRRSQSPPEYRECYKDILRPIRSEEDRERDRSNRSFSARSVSRTSLPSSRASSARVGHPEIFQEAIERKFGNVVAAFKKMDAMGAGYVTLAELEWAADQSKTHRTHAHAFLTARGVKNPGRVTLDEFIRT